MDFVSQSRSYGEVVRWCPTSLQHLSDAEAVLLKHIKSLDAAGEYVSIGSVIGSDDDVVFTYKSNSGSSATPLVLIHGFGCASAMWCLNVDQLATHRPVYFMDVLGFGRSSRPNFSADPKESEDQLIESIEAWRKAMGLEEFFLLGHSFGAYLATAYAIKYPQRIVHLILEDPWGFPRAPLKYTHNSVSIFMKWILSHFVQPLFLVRWLGPLGSWYLRNILVPFEADCFEEVAGIPKSSVYDYFYHCNVRNPTGEVAFHQLMTGVAWPKFPMVDRVASVRSDVPMTFLHGRNSWVSKSTSFKVKELRKDSYVNVKIIEDVGHMIHSEKAEEFNSIVNALMSDVENNVLPRTSK